MVNGHSELKLIANKEFKNYDDMYKVVDFLNKNLKSEGLIFGLTKKDDMDVISIYNTNEAQK